MKVYTEIHSLDYFDAWDGAERTKKIICNAGKGIAFMRELEELYPDGIDEGELNDFLWFNSEVALSLVGLEEQE